MPHHPLIEAHLRQLHQALPADAFLELAAGLEDTYDHFRAQGLDDGTAARAALADFGAAAAIITAFDRVTPGRRTARTLLATGPLIGACWAAALLSAHAWNWPIPLPARAGSAIILAAVIALLAVTARSRYQHAHRATLTATAGTGGVLLVDLTVTTAAALCAPALTWPLMLAITASLTRASLTASALHTLLNH